MVEKVVAIIIMRITFWLTLYKYLISTEGPGVDHYFVATANFPHAHCQKLKKILT